MTIPASILLGLVATYLFLLFMLARWGERRAAAGAVAGRTRAWVHGLALGVYCSTWTVFGAIGSAVREGYAYLPIYLGPLFMALLAPFVWERLVRLKQRHRLASVADLLGARFGRGGALPALVALVSLVAVVPYVALQLTAIGGALGTLGVASPGSWVAGFVLLMLGFTLRFGVRDARTLVERPGLILVLGIESAVKLLILLLLAFWTWSLADATPVQWHRILMARAEPSALTLVGQTVLAAAASLLLPRMFQVGIVECAAPGELRLARWVFALYLMLVSVAVLPIAALAASGAIAPGSGSDHLLISLPLQQSQSGLALLAFVAGLSAASAMMIAAWLALSTMVSNDLVVPVLLRAGAAVSADRVLAIRRVAVGLTAAASLAWYAGTQGGTLVQMGLLAFAGVAQFAPAVLAGLYVPKSTARAAFCALLVGATAWLLLLVLPYLRGVLSGTSDLSARAMVALSLNALTLCALTLIRPASLRQRLAAAGFLAPGAPAIADAFTASTAVRADDLYALLEQLLGTQRYRQAVERQLHTPLPLPQSQATPNLLQAAERAVAEVFGSASARELVARGLSGRELSMDAVLHALDQSSTRYRVNRDLLDATFEHMHQAVSVVDPQLRLAAWNRRYESLFRWSPGLLEPGRPIADLIADAARMGGLDAAAVQERVGRRLAQLRAATSYRSVRTQPDGRTLDVRGEPLPEGGFVTTFFDITESVRAARELEEANARLEERVAERTRELQRLGELKNQFLAAASHDLLQPLSAARLYLAAAQDVAGAEQSLLQKADGALAASEELLSGLTDLARFDSGQLQPELAAVELGALFASLEGQAQALAGQRGLRLRVRATRTWVRSDPRLLRRIVQNYLANALRYTARGGVLLGVRRRSGGRLEIQVCDSGPGIATDLLPRLFSDLDASTGKSPWGERGLGLGLSGCRRLADVLGHEVAVRSRPGYGSCFSLMLPRCPAPLAAAAASEPPRSRLEGLRVLCVDDHADVLAALGALLSRWGALVVPASSAAEADARLLESQAEIVLIDFYLGAAQPNGLQLFDALRARQPNVRGALLTAETDPALPARCQAAGVPLLRKPIRPATLRALLESFCCE